MAGAQRRPALTGRAAVPWSGLAGAAVATLARLQVLSRDTGRVSAAIDTLRAALGDAATDRALAEGVQLSLPQSLAEARRAITARDE